MNNQAMNRALGLGAFVGAAVFPLNPFVGGSIIAACGSAFMAGFLRKTPGSTNLEAEILKGNRITLEVNPKAIPIVDIEPTLEITPTVEVTQTVELTATSDVISTEITPDADLYLNNPVCDISDEPVTEVVANQVALYNVNEPVCGISDAPIEEMIENPVFANQTALNHLDLPVCIISDAPKVLNEPTFKENIVNYVQTVVKPKALELSEKTGAFLGSSVDFVQTKLNQGTTLIGQIPYVGETLESGLNKAGAFVKQAAIRNPISFMLNGTLGTISFFRNRNEKGNVGALVNSVKHYVAAPIALSYIKDALVENATPVLEVAKPYVNQGIEYAVTQAAPYVTEGMKQVVETGLEQTTPYAPALKIAGKMALDLMFAYGIARTMDLTKNIVVGTIKGTYNFASHAWKKLSQAKAVTEVTKGTANLLPTIIPQNPVTNASDELKEKFVEKAKRLSGELKNLVAVGTEGMTQQGLVLTKPALSFTTQHLLTTSIQNQATSVPKETKQKGPYVLAGF